MHRFVPLPSPNFLSFWAKNCSRCLLQSSRELKFFFHSENFVKTEMNGNPKVQCLVNTAEARAYFYLFIYFWLCWVFVSVRGLSLVAASGGHSSSRCAGLSLSQPLLLWSTGSRRAGSVVVTHGPSCSAACGIFPDQGRFSSLNLCGTQDQSD